MCLVRRGRSIRESSLIACAVETLWKCRLMRPKKVARIGPSEQECADFLRKAIDDPVILLCFPYF